MKPVRLLLDGFGSYANECELDLSSTSVVAICGPNGAGKSTLIDSILWALYGTVPDRGADDVVNQGQTGCRVEVDFEMGPGESRGVHRFRRERSKGRSKAEYTGPDGVESSARGVTAAAVELLNADADQLNLTALARQGAVSAFADLKGSDRRSVLTAATLGDMFDGITERATFARDDARDLSAATHDELEALEQRSARVDVLAEELAGAREEAEGAAQEADRVRRLARGPSPQEVSRAREAVAALHAARERLDAVSDDAERLEATRQSLSAEDEAAAERVEVLRDDLEHAAVEVATALADLKQAKAHSSSLSERVEVLERGEYTSCWVCGNTLDAHAVDELRGEAQTAARAASDSSRAVKALRAEHDQASRSLEAAREKHSNTARALRDAETRTAKMASETVRLETRIESLAQAEQHLDETETAAEEGVPRSQVEAVETRLAQAIKQVGRVEAALADAQAAADALPDARAAVEAAEAELRACQSLVRASSPHGVPLLATMRSVGAFERHANDALGVLAAAEMRFRLSDRKGAPEVLIEAREHSAAEWRDYRLYSGGERMRFDIAMRVALIRSAGVKARTLCLDEGWGALDQDSAHRLQRLMWRLVESGEMEAVWTVSHMNSALDAFDEFILVERSSQGSVATLSVA